jgi:CheY-like chemotaxis protein
MMARILIVEPHPEVRDLLVRIVRRLGHEDVGLEDGSVGDAAIDAALLEPAATGGFELALTLSERGVPVVCVSICPESGELRALEPVGYLLKPFALDELERALLTAIAKASTSPAA